VGLLRLLAFMGVVLRSHVGIRQQKNVDLPQSGSLKKHLTRRSGLHSGGEEDEPAPRPNMICRLDMGINKLPHLSGFLLTTRPAAFRVFQWVSGSRKQVPGRFSVALVKYFRASSTPSLYAKGAISLMKYSRRKPPASRSGRCPGFRRGSVVSTRRSLLSVLWKMKVASDGGTTQTMPVEGGGINLQVVRGLQCCAKIDSRGVLGLEVDGHSVQVAS